MSEPATVTLRGASGELRIALVAPSSMAARYEVAHLALRSEHVAFGAALGMCSVTVRKHVRYEYDMPAFGQRVLDWLLSQGVGYMHAINAGEQAWVLCAHDLVARKEEVAAAEGFFDPSSAPSTPRD